MTSKAHPDGPVGRAQLIMLAAGLDNDTFWNALTAYHRVIPSLASDGTYTTSILNNDTLTVFAATSPDRMAQEVENQFAPWREDLDNHRTPYSAKYTSLNNYYDHLLHYFNPYPFGAFTITQLTGGGGAPRGTAHPGVAELDTKPGRYLPFHDREPALLHSDGVFRPDSHRVGALVAPPGPDSIHPAWWDRDLYYVVIAVLAEGVLRCELPSPELDHESLRSQWPPLYTNYCGQ